MGHGRRFESRVGAGALVLLVHALLLLAWMLAGRGTTPRGESPPQFVSLWPGEPRREAPPPIVRDPRPPSRSSAIHEPVVPRVDPAPEPDAPPDDVAAPVESLAPGVDWAREATMAARRHSDAPAAPSTFSEPPPK